MIGRATTRFAPIRGWCSQLEAFVWTGHLVGPIARFGKLKSHATCPSIIHQSWISGPLQPPVAQLASFCQPIQRPYPQQQWSGLAEARVPLHFDVESEELESLCHSGDLGLFRRQFQT